MKTCCMVVIGHVDHGKTALVQALTGMETDRLPEEKARGLSIVPGFAHCTYADATVDFIDAPGHEDFIQAMISGASGACAALIVICAVEGVSAQTREHLHIAQLLGITRAVVALTKADLLDAEGRAIALAKARAGLTATPFAAAPIVLCSARDGTGVDDLHTALQYAATGGDDRPAPPYSFLPVDRIFSSPGRGTIVTGTLLGRALSREDALEVHPLGRAVTVRGLQSRGEVCTVVSAGTRVAANLRGVSVEEIARGAVLCLSGAAMPSSCFDVVLELLPSATRALGHMDQLRVVFGTGSAVAQIRLFGAGRLEAGQKGTAQLRFQNPMMGFAGQRAILRRLSPPETIGGASFLDPEATAVKAGDTARLRLLSAVQTGDSEQIAHALCAVNGGMAHLADITRLLRIPSEDAKRALGSRFVSLGGDTLASVQSIESCESKILKALAVFHAAHALRAMSPLVTVMPTRIAPKLIDHVLAALVSGGLIRRQGAQVALSGHDPMSLLSNAQADRLGEIETRYQQAGLNPVKTIDVQQTPDDPDLIALLTDLRRIIALRNVALKQTFVFHTDALNGAADDLRRAFPAPQLFSTSQARSALGTSRRIIVPVLEHFDAIGLTLRSGDMRQLQVSPPPAPC